EPADAAGRDERRDDPVALLETRHVLADLGDRSRALVTEDRAGHDPDVPVLQRQVGVAYAAGAELDDDIARPGGCGIDVLDGESPSGFGEHCSPHGLPP